MRRIPANRTFHSADAVIPHGTKLQSPVNCTGKQPRLFTLCLPDGRMLCGIRKLE
jgi:hypothetical protein